ncbi:AraC family transcriptional regulator [Paramixta manurensis]|uniref:AraC family transcriptional regulator n=1 Tax=Paramixta manurensis TaxID=2740817 RepID=A0A6M8UEM2_9GAMM|nr:AraC family transcriptional regulator [Erwiniaceae bacterium PD-1]
MLKTIALLAVPGVQLLDIAGPLDVFAEANRYMQRDIYRLIVIGYDQAAIVSSSGVKIAPDMTLAEAKTHHFDSFLVAGAPAEQQPAADAGLQHALRQVCQQSQRFGSVCSGALLLASTGLLDGHRVTTHWAVADTLAARFPAVSVDTDAIYVCDGPLRTAAGVTSGLDLALKMVEEDLGREVAMAIAASLVMFFRRPVGQLHFSRRGETSLAGRSSLQELQRWAVANLEQVPNVKALATHMNLSTRHITRLFRQALDITPAQWLERERLATARQMLETGELATKQIAARCGYSSVDILRRAFVRQLKTTPGEYRKYFRQQP